MSAQAARALMTIGDVLGLLRGDFPDVTISKIRFLEAEGLVEPQRSPSGYRKFGEADVARLRFVLTAQRDHYLPLRVIRQHLQALDRGETPPALGSRRPAAPEPRAAVEALAAEGRAAAVRGVEGYGVEGYDATDGRGVDAPAVVRGGADATRRPRTLVAADAGAEPAAEVRLTRRQLIDGASITEALLAQLEEYGLIRRSGAHYDGDALAVARVVAALGAFGFEVRNLRAVKAAADRQVGLIEQLVSPQLRRRSPGAHEEAARTAREVAELSVRLHAALVSAGLRESLGP
ncbi:MerR family transcriptional regulator [Actinomadura oligospora]|uniref:transcriptional regulator FtsR n=1 Tax=Actinomadura oligospora TaxID=111804 RepID=UPI000478CEB3|nr:MerR family transcriptional regulator [Actinomadura oligospora]